MARAGSLLQERGKNLSHKGGGGKSRNGRIDWFHITLQSQEVGTDNSDHNPGEKCTASLEAVLEGLALRGKIQPQESSHSQDQGQDWNVLLPFPAESAFAGGKNVPALLKGCQSRFLQGAVIWLHLEVEGQKTVLPAARLVEKGRLLD